MITFCKIFQAVPPYSTVVIGEYTGIGDLLRELLKKVDPEMRAEKLRNAGRSVDDFLRKSARTNSDVVSGIPEQTLLELIRHAIESITDAKISVQDMQTAEKGRAHLYQTAGAMGPIACVTPSKSTAHSVETPRSAESVPLSFTP